MDAIAALASKAVPKPLPIILAVVTNPEAIPLYSQTFYQQSPQKDKKV
jgi:hypothetical protein